MNSYHLDLVFILGGGEDEEVVCTTLPVLITAGAALVFLQLCILATCLLCLYRSPQSQNFLK